MKKGTATLAFLHPGTQSSCFVRSKTDLLLHDLQHSGRLMSHPFGELGLEAHAARIHEARNEAVTAFLDRSEAEWLWFVDADMGFAPDTLDRLVASADRYSRPVLGGLCFAKKSDGSGPFHARRFRIIPTLYRMYETDDSVGFVPMFDYPRDQVVEVDVTGAACILVHRSVMESMRDEVGDRWFTPISVPKGKKGYTEFSEDMSFCVRVKALGHKLHVHTGIQTTHDKGSIYLDEEVFDLQQAMFELFPREDPL